jgi:hypothetical protein
LLTILKNFFYVFEVEIKVNRLFHMQAKFWK